jgi:hypothetical protein
MKILDPNSKGLKRSEVSDLYSPSHLLLDLLRSRQNFLSGYTALVAEKAVENRFFFQLGAVILATPVIGTCNQCVATMRIDQDYYRRLVSVTMCILPNIPLIRRVCWSSII